MAGPLDGVTILDFGQYLAGPIGPMVLADLGAEVIKVEPVAGDAMRWVPKPFVACQRGKSDLAVDLKTDEGREIAYRLVAQADVVHHNMTKGTAARLQLDYPTLRAHRPDLIYCNTYAYGEQGPLSHFGGLDPLYQAASGLEYEAGPVHAGNPPLYYRFGMSDTANGIASAQGILLALHHRMRTGEGQYVTTSLLDASMLYTSEFFRTEQGPAPRRPRLDQRQTGTTALYRLYETQDGWIQLAAVTEAHWAALCALLRREDLREDPRFATVEDRLSRREQLEAILEPLIRAQTSRMWALRLDDAGIPAEIPVDTVEGELVLFDEDNVRLGLVAEYEHEQLGRMRQYGRLIDYSDTPIDPQGPPPRAGEHTREILIRLGYDEAEISDLRERKVVYEPDDDYPWPV
jgi:crotonobetainyl-CoA:carnitine CoA-transferase CaiB-like acyl-CoA transferase